MNLLDTDILSLLMKGHERIAARYEQAAEVGITIVSRIEVLQGRFASVLKAARGEQLLQAQRWLGENEDFLDELNVVPFDSAAAAAFDTLRQNKRLKKIGRADLLIASIALARRDTLVTRNMRHFRQVSGLIVDNWAE